MKPPGDGSRGRVGLRPTRGTVAGGGGAWPTSVPASQPLCAAQLQAAAVALDCRVQVEASRNPVRDRYVDAGQGHTAQLTGRRRRRH